MQAWHDDKHKHEYDDKYGPESNNLEERPWGSGRAPRRDTRL